LPTTKCPLPGDHEHELLESKKGVPYVRCDKFGTNVFFKNDFARNWLKNQNNGGYAAAIENPIRTVETYGPAEDVGDPMVDFQPNPTVHPIRVWGRCDECGTPILVEDLEACSRCGEPIAWEE